MKTIIATIKPVHLNNIRRGVKLLEIRKTVPLYAPFRVLCCESGSGGQIKAEFVCDSVKAVKVFEDGVIQQWSNYGLYTACITYDELAAYIGHGRTGYAWNITNMVDYCNTKGQRVRHISEYGLKRPPQSWQYVKEEPHARDRCGQGPCLGKRALAIPGGAQAGGQNSLFSILQQAQVVDAEPVRHGRNVTPTHYSDMFVCSECGFVCEITKLVYADEDHPEVGPPNAYEYDCKFCPDCGEKMRCDDETE